MQADLPFEVLEILSDAKQAYSVHKTDDWRVAHSERPALCLELLRVWVWPVRVWLAWWGLQ